MGVAGFDAGRFGDVVGLDLGLVLVRVLQVAVAVLGSLGQVGLMVLGRFGAVGGGDAGAALGRGQLGGAGLGLGVAAGLELVGGVLGGEDEDQQGDQEGAEWRAMRPSI